MSDHDLDETLPGGWRNRAPTAQEFVLHYEAHRIPDTGYSMARWQYEYKRGDVSDLDRRGERQVGPATEYRPSWKRSRPLTADGDVAPWPAITPRSRLEYEVGLARGKVDEAEAKRRSRQGELGQATVAASVASEALSAAEKALAEFDAKEMAT